MSKIDIYKEDIWDAKPIDGFIVVPTNIGWKKNGENIMGAGLAKEAAERYFELPKLYGKWCKEHSRNIYVNDKLRVICAPTKALNEEEPWLSWKNKSEPRLVLLSYMKILRLALGWLDGSEIKSIKCPILGSGKGGITKNDAVECAEQFDWPKNVRFFEK